MYYFKEYENYATSKGITTISLEKDEIEVTEIEYNDVILPAKKIDGVWVSVDPSEVPTPPPYDPYEGMTNIRIQEQLLQTERNIDFKGETITVNQADELFLRALAINDSVTFTELSDKIVVATNDIRERYPVEGQEMLTNTSIFSEIAQENTMLKSQVTALTQQNAFNEEVIYEIIMKIYE